MANSRERDCFYISFTETLIKERRESVETRRVRQELKELKQFIDYFYHVDVKNYPIRFVTSDVVRLLREI